MPEHPLFDNGKRFNFLSKPQSLLTSLNLLKLIFDRF